MHIDDLADYDFQANGGHELWHALESQVLFVVDEHGVNMANAQVRHMLGSYWLYVDDVEGYEIMTQGELEFLDVSEDRPGLGYDGNGNVIQLA